MCLRECVRECVCGAAQVGWISIASSTEPVIQPAQTGLESNQGPGCDVTVTELCGSCELGGVSAMNHIGPLCW